jgi:hypothetical protein
VAALAAWRIYDETAFHPAVWITERKSASKEAKAGN